MADQEEETGGVEYPGRMLHQAAIYNNTDFLASLLEGDEQNFVNAQDPFGRTALYTSVTNNSLECARILLEHGADPNIACGTQCGCMTPLHAAALDDKHQFIALLLQAGADIDAGDATGEKPLQLALKNRAEECVRAITMEMEKREHKQREKELKFIEACKTGLVGEAEKLRCALTPEEVERIVNEYDSQYSLFFTTCEDGKTEMVQFLLDCGVDAAVQIVKGMSPLHVACIGGHVPVIKVLLQKHPELIHLITIEDGSLPTHVAAEKGNGDVMETLLNFSYPEDCVQIFRETGGDRMYRLGVSVNAKNARGHTALHVACTSNKPEIVRFLVNFKVKAARVTKSPSPDGTDVDRGGSTGTAHRNVGLNIRYRDLESPDAMEATEDLASRFISAHKDTGEELHPVDVDMLDLDGNTPLHLAVKGADSTIVGYIDGARGYFEVAELLLQHGANPNKPLISPSGNSSALQEACLKADVRMMCLLLKYKAQDPDLKVLSAAVMSQHDGMIGTILKYKAYSDSEFKINKTHLLHNYFGEVSNETGAMQESYDSSNAIFPSHSVVINWHGLQLPSLSKSWLLESCCLHNVNLPPSQKSWALYAVTRIDVSNNNLLSLPEEVFNLPSLRLLNASENHIAQLPETVTGFSTDTQNSSESKWNCPWLEDIQLQKNMLKSVPGALFKLPALQKLNLSHNELDRLPYDMWSSAVLYDLNVSHNRLKDLPSTPESTLTFSSENSSMKGSTEALNAPEDGAPLTIQISAARGTSPDLNEPKTPIVETPASPSHSIHSSSSDHITNSNAVYREVEVAHHAHWRGRLNVKISLFDNEGNGNKNRLSQLTELNLSYNEFDTVPMCLACMSPKMSKLNMSHNKLTQIGHLSSFPVSLKSLDLSYNQILGHLLFDGSSEDNGDPRWSNRICFKPSSRFRSKTPGPPPTPTFRTSRTNSNTSLQSMSSSSAVSTATGTSGSAVPFCIHRSHNQLEELKTLKLDHNRLQSVMLSLNEPTVPLTGGADTASISSASDLCTEDLNRSPAKRLSSQPEVLRRKLLYPNLTMLDASYNNMTSVPPDVSEVAQLAELKLNHNKLKELPPEMGMLKKLWNLDISGCPVEKTYQALLGEKSRKTSAVLGYLKSIKDEAVLYNRMKLMLVGVQGIGKTSLLNQLRKEDKAGSVKNKNWAQRMGHGNIKDKDLRGENISTVGVDIGDLVLQKGSKKVVFRTWDFGGQREYYATHQYFLSKRSIYLVVWKVTDGEKGVTDILQWLVNIQARAPNSPVIIVGTHLDQVTKRRYPETFLADLQHLLFKNYMSHTEPEKSGLPRVMGHVEISTKSKFGFNNHISDLVNLLFRVACEEQLPGSKGAKLIEQKVPATYVQLQDVITCLSEERKQQGKDPVLHTEEYKVLVLNKMEEMYQTCNFHDSAELNQATQFLHENGILLHYDDINLQNVYFLDPQWLCDVLANVVTIREINSLAKCGIMRTEDLKLLFKDVSFKPEDIKSYIIDLLSKFEVALMWDERNLLIPSLLPTEQDLRMGLPQMDIRIPVLGSEATGNYRPRIGAGCLLHSSLRVVGGSAAAQLTPQPRENGRSTFYIDPTAYDRSDSSDNNKSGTSGKVTEVASSSQSDDLDQEVTSSGEDSGIDGKSLCDDTDCKEEALPSLNGVTNPAMALTRLYLMSYFPSGFWPRLITRLLGDSTIYNIVLELFDLPDELKINKHFMKTQGNCPEWKCWQTGLELRYLGVVIVRLKEVQRNNPETFCDYRQCKLVIRNDMDVDWSQLDMISTSILEILVPNDVLDVKYAAASSKGRVQRNEIVQHNPQVTAGLMAKIVDHVDTLLEDWYPDLGARFVQNSRGMYLITRIVPCNKCLLIQKEVQEKAAKSRDAWAMVDLSPNEGNPTITSPICIDKAPRPSSGANGVANSVDVLGESPDVTLADLQTGSAPAGITREWMENMVYSSGRKFSAVIETVGTVYNKAAEVTGGLLPRFERNVVFSFTVEEYITSADLQYQWKLVCPRHYRRQNHQQRPPPGHPSKPSSSLVTDPDAQVFELAPDVVFQDIGDQYRIDPDQVTRGRLLGRGAFGAVFSGTVHDKWRNEVIDVAMKMLQPVHPGTDAEPILVQQYQAEKNRWDKEPMKNACEAYLNARKELSILLALQHPNIVPLLGISLQPLCLVLSLAPLGSLNDQLKEYRRAGARLAHYTLQRIIIQVSFALSYLHSCQIIYRDLKSENVLVWSLPAPHLDDPGHPVHVKLADYGVSRTVLPSGAKGFAGTPPFIAPEIIQHNGEETYTEKVDCFSFGMFIYEILMLKLPFEDGESGAAAVANLKGHILGGGRPHFSPNETSAYPTHLLDLMVMCWSHDQSDRPSAQEVTEIASAPTFSHLKDVTSLEGQVDVLCAASSPIVLEIDSDVNGEMKAVDVWTALRIEGQGQLHVFTYHNQNCISSKVLVKEDIIVRCMCVTAKHIWCADTSANVRVFSLDDYSERVKFSATSKSGIQVKTLAYSSSESQVFIVLDSGRLVLCDSDIPLMPAANYTPVKTECPGNNKPIHCIAVLPKALKCSELWCGQSKGRMSVFNLSSVSGNLKSVAHPDVNGDVFLLATRPKNARALWSYVYPGSVLYRWDVEDRKVTSQCDISTLIPYGDEGASCVNQGKISAGKCQVTAMLALSEYLYVASTWGCIIILDNATMAPCVVFRPHGDVAPYIRTLLPLVQQNRQDMYDVITSPDNQTETTHGILSIGIGYRNMLAHSVKTSTIQPSTRQTDVCLLSWLAEHWKHTCSMPED